MCTECFERCARDFKGELDAQSSKITIRASTTIITEPYSMDGAWSALNGQLIFIQLRNPYRVALFTRQWTEMIHQDAIKILTNSHREARAWNELCVEQRTSYDSNDKNSRNIETFGRSNRGGYNSETTFYPRVYIYVYRKYSRIFTSFRCYCFHSRQIVSNSNGDFHLVQLFVISNFRVISIVF